MNFHLILICLISEILCISYLSKDAIISLPTNSDTGIIYLKRSEFKQYSNIYIKFRINKGKINTILSYEITNTNPVSGSQFSFPNEANCINNQKFNETTTYYTFGFNLVDSHEYYVIKYTGFSGNSIDAGCSYYADYGLNIPKGKDIYIPSSKINGSIYLKYEDFSDSNDIYAYFKIHNSSMNNKIQYQETNIDPSYILASAEAKELKCDNQNEINNDTEYIFSFSNSKYKYLIIYYYLLGEDSLTVSSSIKIKYISKGNITNLNSNFDYGYIYLQFSDFAKTKDNIYLNFTIYGGIISSYIEYQYSNNTPIVEGNFTSLKHKKFDIIDTDEDGQFYSYRIEFSSDNNYYKYLVIKYTGFTGKSISVISSIKIRYLSKDKKFDIFGSEIEYGYIYLNLDDFSNTDDDQNNTYLYLENKHGKINSYLYYLYTNEKPIYESQFSLTNIKNYHLYFPSDKYIYKFVKKLEYKYLIIKYILDNPNQNYSTLDIYSLSFNPIASLISEDQMKTLPHYSKSEYIYITIDKSLKGKTLYVYFEVDGIMNSHINYLKISNEPKINLNLTINNVKYSTQIDENRTPKIYSFKFDKIYDNYLLIRYYGFSGTDIKVTYSTKNPFGLNLSILEIACISISSFCVIGIIIILIILLIIKRKKELREARELTLLDENIPFDSHDVSSIDNIENVVSKNDSLSL